MAIITFYLQEIMGLNLSLCSFFAEQTNDSKPIGSRNQISSVSSEIQQQQDSRKYRIEDLLEEELQHLKNLLEEEYNRLIEAKQQSVRRRIERRLQQCLKQAILNDCCSQPIIKISPLPGSKISWVSTHPQTRIHRKYSEFIEANLLSRLENFLILRDGQKQGSKLISQTQSRFQMYYYQDLKDQLSQAKVKFRWIFQLILTKIIEENDKKMESINQRNRDQRL